MSIRHLPYEITAYVAGYLDPYDVYNFSATCRHFRFLALENNICRTVLEVNPARVAPARPRCRCGVTDKNQATPTSAWEMQQARDDKKYARALRRLIKRREAIATASPFLVSIVAYAESWIYENGVICYIRDRMLRVLDVHNSAAQEIVTDVRLLLDRAVHESRTRTKYKFRLLYYAHGIVSCIYTHAKPDRESWLVVFNPDEEQILTAYPLESTHKIFVRNDERHLYYGTFSELAPDGFKRWALRGFDISEGKWFDGKLHIPDIMGADLGSTTCFEIINGYFYGISNQTYFEIEEIDWTSYYYCFRFPTDRPSLQYTEYPPKRHRWRRQHAEGTIDDRWTFLKLFKDEISGDLTIIESRKEWLSGHGSGTRTYYTKKLIFGDDGEEEAEQDGQCQSTGSLYPIDDELARLLGKDDHPNYMPAPKREPKDVHLGDDSSVSVMFTQGKTPVRSYHHHAPQTFVDLVDDPHPSEPNSQRIRIRAGARRLRNKEERRERLRTATARHGEQYTLRQEIEDLYDHAEVVYWPGEQLPNSPSQELDDLHRILNPPGYTGNVHGEWDERSLVYSTGGTSSGGLNALVLISFDPGIHLKGVRRFGKLSSPENRGRPGLDGSPLSADLALRKREGKRSEDLSANSLRSQHSPSSRVVREPIQMAKTRTWTREEPAMYQTIGRGYHFAR